MHAAATRAPGRRPARGRAIPAARQPAQPTPSAAAAATQERLAAWQGAEEAILYSYDLATLPSIIPAFASKKDLIFMDEVRC